MSVEWAPAILSEPSARQDEHVAVHLPAVADRDGRILCISADGQGMYCLPSYLFFVETDGPVDGWADAIELATDFLSRTNARVAGLPLQSQAIQ